MRKGKGEEFLVTDVDGERSGGGCAWPSLIVTRLHLCYSINVGQGISVPYYHNLLTEHQ